MITMHNAWHADRQQRTGQSAGRAADDQIADIDELRREQILFGQLGTERSISAPPPTGTASTFDSTGGGDDAAGSRSLLFGEMHGNERGSLNAMPHLAGKSNDDFFVDSGSFLSSGRGNSSGLVTSSSEGLLFDQGKAGTNNNGVGLGRSAATTSSAGMFSQPETLLTSVGREPALSGSNSSPSLQQLSNRYAFDLDARSGADAEGQGISRSQSAAPEFTSRGMRPPPGMGGGPTSSTNASSGGGTGSLLFDSSADRDAIMRAGERRPASTGVIGQQYPSNSSSSSLVNSLGLIHATTSVSSTDRAVGGAVRPAPKTLMDLIQEDFPKTPSPVYRDEVPVPLPTQQQQQPSNLSTEEPSYQDQYNGSPQDQQRQIRYQHQQQDQPQNRYHQPQEPRQNLYHQHDDVGALANSMEGLRVGSVSSHSVASVPQREESLRTTTQYVSVPVSQLQGHASGSPSHGATVAGVPPHNTQQAVYTASPVTMQQISGANHHTHPHAVPHQTIHQNPYEAQTIYYSTQQQRGSAGVDTPIQTQILHPSASGHHAVYVNAAPPYGYATVQYHPAPPPHPHHPHAAARHVIHAPHPNQVSGSGHHHPQEYISVLPIHTAAGTPVQVAPNGAYAYWPQQADLSAATSAGMPPTVTIMSAHGPGGTPVALAGVGAPHSSSPPSGRHTRNKNSTSGRSSDKGGSKSRRGGGSGGRRSGGQSGVGVDHHAHSKHSPGSIGVASTLLEEFRLAKNRVWTMDDIRGHIVEFCQDQNGSRFIQQRLEVAGQAEKLLVMSEVLPAIRRLRNDVFGNYVVQKLLEHGTPQMKSELRDTLTGEMLPLSLQMYGCRVVQKALEALDDDDLPPLLTEFHHNVISCIHDQNGNHVMQKCIEVMSSKARKARDLGDMSKAAFFSQKILFIIDDVLRNVAALSCHPYGCRVLQRILEHCDEPQKTRALDDISHCHRTLLDDQYGNYVIQHVLQFGRHSDRESILSIVVASGLLSLSKQKFASNVVEKLLQYGSPEQRNALVREMLKVVDENTGAEVAGGSGGSSVVLLMVRDAYANYVVQTTLDVVAEGEERRLLLEELNANSTQLRNYTFAKHIVTKLGT